MVANSPPGSQHNQSRKVNWKESEKDLVAEQSGLGLSLIGIFLALLIGLAFRAWVSPEKVRFHLEKAVTVIHQDLQFKFKRAYVSLADGIFPEFSVVIQSATVESQLPCFLTPLAEINEIRLPLSWWKLFQGQIDIHEVVVDEVNLSLRSEYESCNKQAREPSSDSSSTSTSTATTAARAETAATDLVAASSLKSPIDTIRFQTLKVHYLPKAFTSFEMQNLMIKLKSEDPRWVEATGRLNLGGDSLIGDYNSQADLKVDWVEGDQPSVTASAKGIWREGHYNLQLLADLKSQQFDFHSKVHHLPLSQVIPLFKKYRLMESDFNGKKAWLSGEIKMKGLLGETRRTPIRFENFKLEGDIGEITCSQAEIESLDPFKSKPIDLSIKGLNIHELLVFLNRSHPSPALGNLGVFNGNAHFINPENVIVRGDYSGLEFIFANRGSRQTQILSLVSGELILEKKRWHISLDRLRPSGGIFEGKVHITADKDFRDLDLEARIDELSLSPEVQALMTNGGSLGAMAGNLKARILSADIQNLRGNLKWDQLLIEGVHLTKPRVQLQTKGSETWIQLSANDLDLTIQNPSMAAVFAPLIQELKLNSDEHFLFKNPRSQIRTDKLTQLNWTNFQAQTNRGLIQSQGGWNEKSEMFGELRISGSKKSNWVIGGNRNGPTLRKKESAP